MMTFEKRKHQLLGNLEKYQRILQLFGSGNYTRKNAQVVTSLQTSCDKSVHQLSTSCVRTASSWLVVTNLEQVVNSL